MEGEPQKRAMKVRDTLIQNFGINPNRIEAEGGGYREEGGTHLWLVPSGAQRPRAEPTLDASQVQFVSASQVAETEATGSPTPRDTDRTILANASAQSSMSRDLHGQVTFPAEVEKSEAQVIEYVIDTRGNLQPESRPGVIRSAFEWLKHRTFGGSDSEGVVLDTGPVVIPPSRGPHYTGYLIAEIDAPTIDKTDRSQTPEFDEKQPIEGSRFEWRWTIKHDRQGKHDFNIFLFALWEPVAGSGAPPINRQRVWALKDKHPASDHTINFYEPFISNFVTKVLSSIVGTVGTCIMTIMFVPVINKRLRLLRRRMKNRWYHRGSNGDTSPAQEPVQEETGATITPEKVSPPADDSGT